LLDTQIAFTLRAHESVTATTERATTNGISLLLLAGNLRCTCLFLELRLQRLHGVWAHVLSRRTVTEVLRARHHRVVLLVQGAKSCLRGDGGRVSGLLGWAEVGRAAVRLLLHRAGASKVLVHVRAERCVAFHAGDLCRGLAGGRVHVLFGIK